MPDYSFYHVGFLEPRGLRRAVVPVRRGLRRLLRPMFLRLAEILQRLGERQEVLIQQIESQGRQIELCDRQLESQGRQLESQGRQLESQGRQLESQIKEIESQARQIDRLVAYRWDHGAVVHRLAVLEEQVETLLRRVPEARAAVPDAGLIPAGRHWWLVHPDHGPATMKAPCVRDETHRRRAAVRPEEGHG